MAHDPVLILQADAPDAVRRTLTDVEQLTRDRGLHAIGFVTYEAGAAFGLPVHDTHRAGVPLAWFGLYEPSRMSVGDRLERGGDYAVGPLTPSVGFPAFAAALTRVRLGVRQVGRVEVVDGLKEGDTVITAGHTMLRDNASIRIVNLPVTAAPGV